MARRQGWQRWGFREERWTAKPTEKRSAMEEVKRKIERSEIVERRKEVLMFVRAVNELKVYAEKEERRKMQQHREYINKYGGIII